MVLSGIFFPFFIFCAPGVLDVASGHGRMIEPPQRSSMWRYGFDTPKNYNDNELNCGGFVDMMKRAGGKCGPCGDPFWGPRQNEAGGKYALGIIAKKYEMGQVINVTIELTSNHKGFFEFRLCPNNNPYVPVTEECLDRHLLTILGYGTRYVITSAKTVMVDLNLLLPPGLSCSQCILQWKWRAAQNRGTDPRTGKECFGCGPQEYFINCADIAIGRNAIEPIPRAPATTGQAPVQNTPVKSIQSPSVYPAVESPPLAKDPFIDPYFNMNPYDPQGPGVMLDLVGQNSLFVDTGPHFDQPGMANDNTNFQHTPFNNGPVIGNDYGDPFTPLPPTAMPNIYTTEPMMAAAAFVTSVMGESATESAIIECGDGLTPPICKGNPYWNSGQNFDEYCTTMCPQNVCPLSLCMCTCPTKGQNTVPSPPLASNPPKCRAIDSWNQSMNTWCAANCKMSNLDACPFDLCTCDAWGA